MDPLDSARSALRRSEQALVLAALATVTLAAWLGTVATARSMAGMHRMDGMGMATTGWNTAQVASIAVMWIVMMIAMMLPSAAPMVLVHASVARRQRARWRLITSFVSGYLLVWSVFGLAATALQWSLDRSGALIAGGRLTSTIGGGVLVAAGAYQFTTWKQACLRQCRTPMSFLLHDWREGTLGSLRMGLRHGLTCTGCCLGLMLVMFAVGVMSLAWMAVVTAIIAAEKVLPGGPRIATAGGALLIAGGVWVAAGAPLT